MDRFHRQTFLALVAGCAVLLTAVEVSAQTEPAPAVDNPPAQPVVTVSKPSVEASAQPSSQPQAQTGFGAANGDYVLRPGDVIEMIVYREPDLSLRSKIGKDGMVQLPLLGELKIAGLSVRSATQLIRQRYNADYLVEPQIYLNIAAYNSRKFTIIGQVGKPGAYEFGGGEEIGLLEAIGMAGGFTRIADRGRVVVKRREGDSVRTYKVNAKRLADSGVDKFQIENGDVINVGESWY